MRIWAVDREWVHNQIVEPYVQGARLMNRAWQGVDFEYLNRPVLSLNERVVSWISGLALMTPFINLIVWMFWQSFGEPSPSLEPFCPEEEAHLIEMSSLPNFSINYVPQIESPQAIPHSSHQRKADFSFQELGGFKADWALDFHENCMIATRKMLTENAISIYKSDWTIKEFHYQSTNGIFDVVLMGRSLSVNLKKNEKDPIEQIFQLEEAIPWIQQPTFGFRNFILSQDTELNFYGVVPENPLPFGPSPPFVMKCIAKKIGIEEVPGFGKLQKVEVVSQWGFPYNQVKGEFWFDPTDGPLPGMLRKFIDPGIVKRRSGEFVPNHRLSEQERQEFLAHWQRGLHL